MKNIPAFPERVEYKSCNATIYSHKNRNTIRYEIKYYDLDGSRQRVTFPTYASANTFANTVVEELAENRAKFVTLRGPEAYEYQTALELLRPSDLSISQAATMLVENHRLLAGRGKVQEAIRYFVDNRPQHSPTITVEEVVDQMLTLKEKEGDVGQLYLRDLRVRLDKFAEAFVCPISKVSFQEIRDYLLNLKVSNRTRHNLRTTLVTLFNFARSEGYLPADHKGVPRPIKRSRMKLAIKIFMPEEMAKLLAKAEGDQIVALCIQGFAGIRAEELKRLQWQHIDLTSSRCHRALASRNWRRSPDILERPATSVASAVEQLAAIRAELQDEYRRMLNSLLTLKKPLAVCTVYDPHFPDPLMQRLTTTALNIFNDCILREAITHGLPVIDLRLICTEPDDYANEIEPGVAGGRKIAEAILRLIQHHDFSGMQNCGISLANDPNRPSQPKTGGRTNRP